MTIYNPWEEIEVPERILQSIKEGDYDGYSQLEKSRRQHNRESFFIIFGIISAIELIIYFLGIKSNSMEVGKYITIFIISTSFFSIVIFFSKYFKDSQYNTEKDRIDAQIQKYQKELYEQQQRDSRMREENERQENNKRVAGKFSKIVRSTYDLIFIAPFLSYANWLKTDELKARGKLKLIYEKLGYKVQFYNYKTLVIIKEPTSYKLLIKYNNSYSKPSVTALNTFIRERTTLQPNESIFLSVEKCSDNAQKIAKENGIKLILLKEFIRHLYIEFVLIEEHDLIKEYFSTGKKSDLIECILIKLDELRIELKSISNKLDSDYFDRCMKTISKLEKLIWELDSKIIDEEPLGT